ncbi:MAG: ATP-binding protein [Leptonema illini]|uniref:ATP-binding protein n=1 Tax=Leptonema illini TaxID=183 RepID=A0A833H2G0_9LEPT|nr:MAG: ATP-binding protein [Leptonema illini]
MTQTGFDIAEESSGLDPLLEGTGYVPTKESSDRIRMQIPSLPSHLHPVRDFVYRLCLQHGCSRSDAFDMKLIAGEALTNIMKHAYGGRPDGAIFIDLLFFRTFVEMRFRDFAPVNNDKLTGKDLSEYRQDGLGLYLITSLSDYHYFDRSRGTLLVVKKRFQS